MGLNNCKDKKLAARIGKAVSTFKRDIKNADTFKQITNIQSRMGRNAALLIFPEEHAKLQHIMLRKRVELNNRKRGVL